MPLVQFHVVIRHDGRYIYRHVSLYSAPQAEVMQSWDVLYSVYRRQTAAHTFTCLHIYYESTRHNLFWCIYIWLYLCTRIVDVFTIHRASCYWIYMVIVALFYNKISQLLCIRHSAGQMFCSDHSHCVQRKRINCSVTPHTIRTIFFLARKNTSIELYLCILLIGCRECCQHVNRGTCPLRSKF